MFIGLRNPLIKKSDKEDFVVSYTVEQIVNTSPVIPVIVVDKLEQAAPLAQALYKGGLKVLEITMRTPIALEAMQAMKAAVPEAIVGAGTIVSPEDVDAALAAGADFLVSPGATDIMIDAAQAQSVPLLPGVATPSEAMRLKARGLTFLKFFPAEAAGGVNMLKSIGGPLGDLRFCPTGGINLAKAPEYLALPNVVCVGGSWMVPKQLVEAGDWQGIETLAREAAGLAR